jgi:hypothetical protein
MRIYIGKDFKIAKILKSWQVSPTSTCSPGPLATAIQEVLWAADVALGVDQAARAAEEEAGSLCQHEMLPDIPCVACVGSVVVASNLLHL